MNKICKVCRLEQPNHKMSCKDSNKEYVIPTAEEVIYYKDQIFFNDSPDTQGTAIEVDSVKELLNDFTNLHLDNAIKEWSEYLTWCSLEYTTPLTYIDWLKDYKLRNKLN
jgi:hypothetical protein